MTKSFHIPFVFCVLCFTSAYVGAEFADAGVKINPGLLQELSSRHPTYTENNLVDLCGSEDELVSQLLILRLTDKPANTAINAQKVLINFSHREDVREALLEDVSMEDRFGLGSVVLGRIDDIEDAEFRVNLAKKALHASDQFDSIRSSRFRLLLKESKDLKLKLLSR